MNSTRIDWAVFGKRRSLTFDDLRRYSAADLDPYTVQVGEALCENLTFSQLGQRNLVTTFDSLPGNNYQAADFEIGYGAYHIIRVILKTNTGFSLAALVGLLAEYFREDVVVDLFIELAHRTQIPAAYRPLKHQWRSMVNTLYGVLSTSSFGTLLSTLEDTLPATPGDIDLRRLLDTIDSMSRAVEGGVQTIQVTAGPDLVWLAAVASWLFDLKLTIRSPSSDVIYATLGTTGQTTQLTINLTTFAKDSPNPESPPLLTNSLPTGGRVSFERFFRTCFGDTATILRDDALAAYLCCASNLLQSALGEAKLGSQSPFLIYDSAGQGVASHGVAESMLAWFPELRQIGSKFKRYEKLNTVESRTLFDEASNSLKQQCRCSACGGSDNPSTSGAFCKVSLAEVVFNLGLYIRHMIISPKLYPKRNGVLALYQECHAIRLADSQSPTSTSAPSNTLITYLMPRLSSSLHMLQISALLFANSNPAEINSQTIDLMGITTTGLTVYLSGPRQFANEDGGTDDPRKLSIMVSPGWICLYGHEAKYEAYKPAFAGRSFDEQWDITRTRPGSVRQIMRWEGRVMLSSIVDIGSKEEEQARKEGWVLLT